MFENFALKFGGTKNKIKKYKTKKNKTMKRKTQRKSKKGGYTYKKRKNKK